MADMKPYNTSGLRCFRRASKSRLMTLCGLRDSVMVRALNATTKDPGICRLFRDLLDEYRTLIELEEALFNELYDRESIMRREGEADG